MNLYTQFKDILKKDDLDRFIAFFSKYYDNFDRDDFTLIIKYNSKKIFEYYIHESSSFKFSVKYEYLFEMFNLSLFYKYLVIYTDDEFLEILLKTISENYTHYCDSTIDVDYELEFNSEHPYLDIATYCLEYNTRIDLFKRIIKNKLKYYSNYQCLYNASEEFFDIILEECNDIMTLCNILKNCSEKQLEKILKLIYVTDKECSVTNNVLEILNYGSKYESDVNIKTESKESSEVNLESETKVENNENSNKDSEMSSEVNLEDESELEYRLCMNSIFENDSINFNFIKTHFKITKKLFKKLLYKSKNRINEQKLKDFLEFCRKMFSIEETKRILENV